MNPVVHFEFPYRDRARIVRFYTEAFGWKLEQLGPEMGEYVLATTAEGDAMPGKPAGAINGGFYACREDGPAEHPSVVIGVQDIAEAMRKVQAAGGQVMGEPMPIPGVGLYVAFRDTEGNRNAMLQPQRG